jgi:hypothetical protein
MAIVSYVFIVGEIKRLELEPLPPRTLA